MDSVITCLYKNILQMLPWSKPCKKCDRFEQWLQLFPAFLSVFCRTKSCARHKTILENSCRVIAFILTQVFARFSEKNVRLFDTYVIDRQHDTYCCSYKLPIDIIWLDSQCVFWFVQYVVLLTYCNVSSDIYIYLFSTMVFRLYFVVLHKLVGAETKWPLRPSLRVPALLIKYSMLGRDTEINWTGAEFRLFCSCRSSLTFSVKLGHRRTADARNVFVIMTPVN